jgi:hypothetical protein
LQEQAPGICERYVATIAHEKAYVELFFQLADLATQRRDSEVQLLRSFRKAEMLCNRDKVPKLTKFHRRSPPFANPYIPNR